MSSYIPKEFTVTPNELDSMHVFPYSIEVEADSSKLYDKNYPVIKRLTKQSGFSSIYEIVSGDDSHDICPTEPRLQKNVYKQTYGICGYNDGSVPFELVIGSHNPYKISKVADEMNEEIIHTTKIGQHISILIDRRADWHRHNNYYAVQNLALILERAMLRHHKHSVRPREFWRYIANGDSSNIDKYSVVNRKSVSSERFLEFRLHHAIPSALVYFEFFPHAMQQMDKNALSILRMLQNPMTNDKSYYIGAKLIERNFDNNFLESLPLNLLSEDDDK